MAQYGVGPELAAQCPRVPPPDGWRPWLESDGPVPDALAKRVGAIASDTSVPLGATESYPLPGITALIRVEPHAWGRDEQGNLVQGCFRAGSVFLPSGTPDAEGIKSPEEESKWSKAVTILTAASLAAGTIATIYSLKKGG